MANERVGRAGGGDAGRGSGTGSGAASCSSVRLASSSGGSGSSARATTGSSSPASRDSGAQRLLEELEERFGQVLAAAGVEVLEADAHAGGLAGPLVLARTQVTTPTPCTGRRRVPTRNSKTRCEAEPRAARGA